MKRKIVIVGVLTLALLVLKIKVHMQQKNPGQILYDYVMALHADSKVDLPDHGFYTPEQKATYAEMVMIGRCPSCNRFFLRKIMQCPRCHYEGHPFALEAVGTETFKAFALACEQFHQSLLSKSGIKTFSYSQIMKLYYLKGKPVDVR